MTTDISTLSPNDARRPWYYTCAIIALALFILCVTTWWPIQNSIPASQVERIAKMDALFGALPDWVKQWMSIQRFIMLGSLWVVWWHKEARVYLLAVVLSHVISYTEIAFAPVERLGIGLVSLNHLVWIPALIFMLSNRSRLADANSFKLWYYAALGQLIFSLTFDIRDSLRYLMATYWQ